MIDEPQKRLLLNRKVYHTFFILVYLIITAGFIYYSYWNLTNYANLHRKRDIYFKLGLSASIILVFIYCISATYGFATKICELFIWIFKHRKINEFPFKLYKSSNFDKLERKPHVAIVCPTCNDFMADVMEQNIKQKYKYVTYFILDDSKDDAEGLEFSRNIDEFKKKYQSVVDIQIIRRSQEHKKENSGKVGNLNNFLTITANDSRCEYVAFIDADTVLRDDYIEKNIKLFYCNIPRLAVITSQVSAHQINSKFSNIIHDRVDNATSYFLLQNSLGKYCYLGWGGIFKRSILEKLKKNGDYFPKNILNDDQGMQMSLTENGYIGFFSTLSPISSQEPLNFFEYNKRENRWWNANADLLMHGNPIMNVKFGHSTRHEKFVFFKGTYLYTIVFPLLLLLVTCINAFIYTITFNDKRIYDITNIWLIIFAFNMISNFIEKLSHFARNGKIKDFLKFYWIAGRIDTLSMYVFRKSIWSLFRSVFLRRKQKAFNRTAKFRKNDNSEEIHMLLKMALINWLWFVIGLIISIILVKCYFSIEHSALYGTLCVLIFVWVCWPNLWKVIFCFISTMRYKAKKETKYFDILNKFNKIRSKYGFELIK